MESTAAQDAVLGGAGRALECRVCMEFEGIKEIATSDVFHIKTWRICYLWRWQDFAFHYYSFSFSFHLTSTHRGYNLFFLLFTLVLSEKFITHYMCRVWSWRWDKTETKKRRKEFRLQEFPILSTESNNSNAAVVSWTMTKERETMMSTMFVILLFILSTQIVASFSCNFPFHSLQ